MRLCKNLLLVSASCIFLLSNSSVASENQNIDVWIDGSGNYHITFDMRNTSPSSSSQEERDIEFFRSLMTNRTDDRLTTTEERVHSLIQVMEHFIYESPRSFSLRPRGQRTGADVGSENQSYIFCVYFVSNHRSTSCLSTSYEVDKIQLMRDIRAAGIVYRMRSNKLTFPSENSLSRDDPLGTQSTNVSNILTQNDWSNPDDYADFVWDSLEELCGSNYEYCFDFGVADRFIDATGMWEVCSGRLNPNTILGGSITPNEEVFNDKKTTSNVQRRLQT